ncbi:MAG: hypothetical protein KDI06_09745 [Calditrichaeota bacterium]|nr:hypothetical protein [Calditrichota bacterium]HQU74633.1 hypothetical protein [Calditrichia bacterium]
MKFAILFFIPAMLLAGCSQDAGDRREIAQGSPVEIDGIISINEWQDAPSYRFEQNDFAQATVFVKHDGKNLLLRFSYQNPQDSTMICPEFFIDTRRNKGQAWAEDDYWFHVSAQDCYAIGKREDYSRCEVSAKDWSAYPNYPLGNQYRKIEEFEVAVPLEFLNLKVGQKIGLCFSLSIYPGEHRLNFPEGAYEDIPESWMELTLR